MRQIDRIGPYSRDEFIKKVASFHGYAAPGVIVGGLMVDLALKHLPKSILFDAICETTSCLPDSVQLLTPCTIGNGWLKIIKLGRYAICLYDKYEGNGIRVYLDSRKIHGLNEIETWIYKLKPKKEQDDDLLQQQIWKAGYSIYSVHPVHVKQSYLIKRSKGDIGICKICGEAYPVKDGAACLGCQGESPYEEVPPYKN